MRGAQPPLFFEFILIEFILIEFSPHETCHLLIQKGRQFPSFRVLPQG